MKVVFQNWGFLVGDLFVQYLMGVNGFYYYKGKGWILGICQVQKGQDGVGFGYFGDVEFQGEDYVIGKGSYEFYEFFFSKWKVLVVVILRVMKVQVVIRDWLESWVRLQIL